MRIGIRTSASTAHGVLMDGGAVVSAATAPLDGSAPGALTALTTGLAAAASPEVDSVTWDVSSVLEEALERASEGRAPSSLVGPGGLSLVWPGSPVVAQHVAAVRVVPRSPAAPGLGAHPSSLVRSLVSWRGTVTGGHDLFGNELAALDLDAALRCAEQAALAGLTTLAITATGACNRAIHEESVAAWLLERIPRLRLCLSHESGGLGLLEREATTVVNAALLDVAENVVAECEQATSALGDGVSCWFATGDGGRVSAKRLRWFPVVGLAATAASALIGAATLSGSRDAVVGLTGPAMITVGQVRGGLPHVEADLPRRIGVRMTTPQPVLTFSAVDPASPTAHPLNEHSGPTVDVVAVLDEGGREVADQLRRHVHPGPTWLRSPADIAAVGAAHTEASAWLDLLIPAETTDELDRLQARAEQQALTLVASNGARPGTERVVKSSAAAVGYLRASLYRLQVRATGLPDDGPAR
ncbi:hypothetical protein [Wenjunlia tyrosinilytica]|uniref:Uncharacterized protein n=1 Tax=Wenjunlia tyrosinilytica TaxID=1544741 RepID=A0A917ZX72_9ACTN|nr:hypothetical protein [Wenjunlia tyrosinilytica]GGO95133.1 hypothetical protein GCM10012280_51650 [Wenjunlia tyrosinilytica]